MGAVLTTISAGTGAGELETGTTGMIPTLADPAVAVGGDTLTIDMDLNLNATASATGIIAERVIDARKEFFFPANRKSDRGR